MNETELALHLSTPAPDNAALHLTCTDTYGRLEWETHLPLARGTQGQTVHVRLPPPVAQAHWVRAELLEGDALAGWRQELLISSRARPEGFPTLMWSGNIMNVDGLRMLRRYRAAGFNIAMCGAEPATAELARLADLQSCHPLGSDGVLLYQRVTGGGNMEEMKTKVKTAAAALAPYRSMLYDLGDEINVGEMNQPFNADDVKMYRSFLNDTFGTLDRLNAEWQTHFTSFDEIQPVDYTDPEIKLLPQKVAKAAFLEHLYTREIHTLCDAIRQGDPGAAVGAEGCDPGNMEEILPGVGFWGPYSDRLGDMRLLSAARPNVWRGMWWGAYHFGAYDRPRAVRHFARQVYEGQANLCLFFSTLPGLHEGISGVDLTLAKWFEDMQPEFHRLLNGPAPLLASAKYVDSGVYVLHSQASARIGDLQPLLGSPRSESLAAFHLLDACGVNYRVLTAEEAARGVDPARVKLLMLPACCAVGEKLALALSDYVNAGGVLLATGACGVYDDFGGVPPAGPLDALLGCHRTGALQPQRLALQGTLNQGASVVPFALGRVWVDGHVVADNAEVVLERRRASRLHRLRTWERHGLCLPRLTRVHCSGGWMAGWRSRATWGSVCCSAPASRPSCASSPPAPRAPTCSRWATSSCSPCSKTPMTTPCR